MNLKKFMRVMAIVGGITLASTAAHANVVIPSLMVLSWIGIVIALIPIIIVEAVTIWLKIDAPFLSSLWVATVANILSTVVGIPIASIALNEVRQKKTINAQHKLSWRQFIPAVSDVIWLDSFDFKNSKKNVKIVNWAAAAGACVILAVFFLASWVTEYFVAAFMLTGHLQVSVNGGILAANAVSYGIIAILIASTITVASADGTEQPSRDNELARARDHFWHSVLLQDAEVWQRANSNARRGISTLKTAEIRIARRGLVVFEGRPHTEAIVRDLQEFVRKAREMPSPTAFDRRDPTVCSEQKQHFDLAAE